MLFASSAASIVVLVVVRSDSASVATVVVTHNLCRQTILPVEYPTGAPNSNQCWFIVLVKLTIQTVSHMLRARNRMDVMLLPCSRLTFYTYPERGPACCTAITVCSFHGCVDLAVPYRHPHTYTNPEVARGLISNALRATVPAPSGGPR